MRDEYNIEDLNPRKNPYARRLKKQITMNIDSATVDYFKSLAESEGIPVRRQKRPPRGLHVARGRF